MTGKNIPKVRSSGEEVRLDAVEPGFDDQGLRGLRAKKALKKGDSAAFVPAGLYLTPERYLLVVRHC